MPEVLNLSKTARDKILERYVPQGTPHEFRTTPVSVTGQMVAEVSANANGVAFLIFRPQVVKFARKGIGDQQVFGRVQIEATEAETNLQRGGSTDGARDMAIEGIQISSVGQLANYFDGGAVTGFGTPPVDPDVIKALNGETPLCDPFGVVLPPQLQSPYLLEEAVYTKLMQNSSLELKLDTSRPFNLGCARLFPGSAGQSNLRANGVPVADNKFLFPEGILWNRDGMADSDLSITLELHHAVVVPINLVTFPGGQAATPPRNVYQRIAIDILGVSVSALGEN